MGEIVNLRMVRKRRQRDERAREADENRTRHGRTKAEKERDRRESAQLHSHLDAHRRGSEDGRDE